MDEQKIVDFATLCNFQAKQREAEDVVLNTSAKYILYGGSAAGGKSYFLRWIAIELGLYYAQKYKIKGIPIGLFSEDYPTLKDRQISRIKREVPAWLGELRESRDEGYVFQIADRFGGARILLRNLDDPSKYASTEFAAECIEELTKNPKETFDDLRFRLRYPGISDPKLVAATNPGGIGHGWVKSLWVQSTAESRRDPEFPLFKFIQAKVSDNRYVDPSYVDQLKALPEQKRKAYLDGSWDVFAGQYFSEWDPKLHVITPFVPHDSVIVGGMDWGYTNPFSFHLATVDKIYWRNEDNELEPFYRVKTFYECYGTEKNPEEWSNRIKEDIAARFSLTLTDISWVQADSAIQDSNDGSVSILDQFKVADDRWRLIKMAAKGPGSRISGWATMHKWLSKAPDGLPFWQVTSNCMALIKTLPELIHDENIIEDVETNRKGNIDDDAADDQRYMLRGIKLMEGMTGQIKSKRITLEEENQSKFYVSNEDASNLNLLDLSKFK